MFFGVRTRTHPCIFFLSVYILASGTLLFTGNGNAEAASAIARHISYSYTLQNESGKALKDAQFRTYAPVKQTPTQKCVKITGSHLHKVITDKAGNRILQFTFRDFPAYGTKIITIESDLLLFKEPVKEKVKDLSVYLKAEPFIEKDDPAIRKKAKELSAKEPLKTARNIARWIPENIKYSGYTGGDYGALWALNRKQGDCTEYMYLFAALCRANGIPARCLEGYICEENMVLKPDMFHSWAEFYHDGAWRIADPSNRKFMQDQHNYIVMRIFRGSQGDPESGFHRFRVTGEGLKVTMN